MKSRFQVLFLAIAAWLFGVNPGLADIPVRQVLIQANIVEFAGLTESDRIALGTGSASLEFLTNSGVLGQGDALGSGLVFDNPFAQTQVRLRGPVDYDANRTPDSSDFLVRIISDLELVDSFTSFMSNGVPLQFNGQDFSLEQISFFFDIPDGTNGAPLVGSDFNDYVARLDGGPPIDAFAFVDIIFFVESRPFMQSAQAEQMEEFVRLQVSGQVTGVSVQVIPVPAALWLFGSALGLLGWLKRRAV
ncbi:MAG: hypothetical protein QNJ73_09895 [Gammaproteobacteria bacterium]|nr:hypothetical protein [Gammaproteobacteria bacterium]